jgi:glycosyltransferase involved in cell wall biosynthesis
MKIGFVSDRDPYKDKKSWSGTTYKLREAIERAGNEIIWIKYDKDFNCFIPKIQQKLLAWYIKLSKKKVIGACYLGFYCKYFAATIERQGVYDKCDCLFFAGPSGGQIALYLKKKIPYIYLADANYHLMENYYWFNLSSFFAQRAKKEEELATQQAWINIRSSQWAADGAVKYCNAPKDNLYVLEFGANIDDNDIILTKPYHSGRLNIIFSGTDWDRKGGDIAIETTKILREKGYDAVINIMGIKELPTKYAEVDYINNIGFLDKNDENDYQKYIEIWKSAHLFILPTRAECAGIVFSEAAAYGVPVFTYNTGGIGNYVIDGKNGYKMELSQGPQDFANIIESCIVNGEIAQLSSCARELYNETLSWNVWSKKFRAIIEENQSALSKIQNHI